MILSQINFPASEVGKCANLACGNIVFGFGCNILIQTTSCGKNDLQWEELFFYFNIWKTKIKFSGGVNNIDIKQKT